MSSWASIDNPRCSKSSTTSKLCGRDYGFSWIWFLSHLRLSLRFRSNFQLSLLDFCFGCAHGIYIACKTLKFGYLALWCLWAWFLTLILHYTSLYTLSQAIFCYESSEYSLLWPLMVSRFVRNARILTYIPNRPSQNRLFV